MSTYSHENETTHVHMSNMTCWSNLDINEFESRGNNDIIQCVTCNRSLLFTPKLKIVKKQGQDK
jgi:hypothetical protein